MKIFLSPNVVCPTATKLHNPMKIWAIEIDHCWTDTPTAYVYLQCPCHEGLIQVDVSLSCHNGEHWIEQKDVDPKNEITRRKVRGMPEID